MVRIARNKYAKKLSMNGHVCSRIFVRFNSSESMIVAFLKKSKVLETSLYFTTTMALRKTKNVTKIRVP